VPPARPDRAWHAAARARNGDAPLARLHSETRAAFLLRQRLERAEELRAKGITVSFVALDGALAGVLGVADPIKSTAPAAIRALHEECLRIAAGVLYPALGVLLSPVLAAAAMSFSSVSVIGNALRLRRAEL